MIEPTFFLELQQLFVTIIEPVKPIVALLVVVRLIQVERKLRDRKVCPKCERSPDNHTEKEKETCRK